MSRKAAEWKEGRREEGRYITVRGFRGLGRAGPSSAARHTRHTGAPSERHAVERHVTSQEREGDCNRGEGTAEPVPQLQRGHASACGQAHFACVCVLKSHSAGSPEAGDGCSARLVSSAGRGREASALLPSTAAVSYWDTSALFVCTCSI